MLSAVTVTADPRSLGFDPDRLARIDRHFAAYVDDGRLPGWQVVVSRHGEVVHHSTYGMRDVDAGRRVDRRHDRAALLHDQADHVGRRDDAVRGGRVRAEAARRRPDPRVRGEPRVPQRQRLQAGHRARHRTGPDVAPADPHRRVDVRLPPSARDRRDLPRPRVRVGCTQGARPGGVLRGVGVDAVGVPARCRVVLQRRHRCARAGRRAGLGPVARRVLRRAGPRAARHGRHAVLRAAGRGRAGGAPLQPGARDGPGGRQPARVVADGHAALPVGRRWPVGGRRRTTSASVISCSGAARSTACGSSVRARSTT
jgi:hypothetical protein